MRFYETREFQRLQREWYQRAAASGFRDIEPMDGVANPDSEMRYGMTTSELELGRASWNAASEALSDEMPWVGLSPQHRRFWALLTMGLSVEHAGRLAHGTKGGGGRAKSHAWHREIRERIGR